MNKLRLDLDDLHVNSFGTAAAAEHEGIVSDDRPPTQRTVEQTIHNPTSGATVDASCVQSCYLVSCGGGCWD